MFVFSLHHCLDYYVCIYILGLKVWSIICLPGEIYDQFNVRSSTAHDFGSASGPYFNFREPRCLNPYQAFYV